jgi:AcrR family transcriptional regulator
MFGDSLTPKGERREQEILQRAADLFFRKGFHATSLEDIAREVGIRKGGLYYYAQTKDDLLFRVVEQGLRSMIEELEAICRSGAGPAEKLKRAIENHVRSMETRWSTLGVLLREDRAVAPQHRDGYVALRDAYEILFRGVIREGVEAGVFRPCDPAMVTRAILGMGCWMAVWYRPGGGQSAANIGSQFCDLVFRGLALSGADGGVERATLDHEKAAVPLAEARAKS